MLSLLLAAAIAAPPFAAALGAADRTQVAIVAYRDAHGLPTAWPMTPYRRWLFDWYFGRVFITLAPTAVRAAGGAPLALADGPASVLLHAEDDAMRDLRPVHLIGAVRA